MHNVRVPKVQRRRKALKYVMLMCVLPLVMIALYIAFAFGEKKIDRPLHALDKPLEISSKREVDPAVHERRKEEVDVPATQQAISHATIDMPYKYPMHQQLPNPRWKVAEAIFNHHLNAKQNEQCWNRSGSEAIFSPYPAALQKVVDRNPLLSEKLEKEFDFRNIDAHTFFLDEFDDVLNDDGDVDSPPWWAPNNGNDLPCTSQVQARLYKLQHPHQTNGKMDCRKVRYLVSKLKQNAHGVGSALTLVAHDLLSSIMIGRVLQVQTNSRWYFSSPHCAEAQKAGWECFFMPLSSCTAQGAVEIVKNRRQALRSLAPVIVKSSFDIEGLSRNDIPSDELFFGPIRKDVCYQAYQEWLKDAGNVYIQGTFQRGADPALFYMLSQAMKYLLRAPQPWFRNMLRHHFPLVGLPNVDQLLPTTAVVARQPLSPEGPLALVYIQERGEPAKFREYYNTFGCHTIHGDMLVRYASRFCEEFASGGGGAKERCRVYISGNTPFKNYLNFSAAFAKSEVVGGVLSTWKHPSIVKANAAESERWGANTPASSWIDLFAGIASTNWICIVQSNWCRVINFMRLTSGRGSCGFVDGGSLMISSADERKKYCIVGPWPTKAFSNRLK